MEKLEGRACHFVCTWLHQVVISLPEVVEITHYFVPFLWILRHGASPTATFCEGHNCPRRKSDAKDLLSRLRPAIPVRLWPLSPPSKMLFLQSSGMQAALMHYLIYNNHQAGKEWLSHRTEQGLKACRGTWCEDLRLSAWKWMSHVRTVELNCAAYQWGKHICTCV